MIIRLSQKLGQKIKVSPRESLPQHENPYADWSAHLFTAGRTQYVIVTNTVSLYSRVMYGRGMTSDSQFLDRVLGGLGEFMVDDGLEFLYRRFVAPSAQSIRFSKALNRSVTGSMNDLVQHVKFVLAEEEMSPYDISFELNKVPLSMLKYSNPGEALRALQIMYGFP